MDEKYKLTQMELIKLGIEKGCDKDSLSILHKMLELQLSHQKNELKKKYFESMSVAQSKMPTVPRLSKNHQTRSSYAKHEHITKYCQPIYTAEGFSVSFFESDSQDGVVKLSVSVMHKSGHSEEYHTTIPIDNKGIKGTANKTDTHAYKSSVSYGKVILLTNVFNISTQDDIDDDGNAAGGRLHINEQQILEVERLIEEVGADKDKFLKFVGASEVKSILASKFDVAISMLERKRNAKV